MRRRPVQQIPGRKRWDPTPSKRTELGLTYYVTHGEESEQRGTEHWHSSILALSRSRSRTPRHIRTPPRVEIDSSVDGIVRRKHFCFCSQRSSVHDGGRSSKY
jgi:hypothetical protein